MELILMKNIIETLKKIKNVYDDGNSKRENEKFVFKKWLSIQQIYVSSGGSSFCNFLMQEFSCHILEN